jgi:hypothetical protein
MFEGQEDFKMKGPELRSRRRYLPESTLGIAAPMLGAATRFRDGGFEVGGSLAPSEAKT